MAAMNGVAFILGVVFIAVWFDVSLLEVLPLLWSVLAFLLYGLCYARCLSAVDFCAVVLALLFGAGLFWLRKDFRTWRRKEGRLRQVFLLAAVAALCVAVNWQSTVSFQDDLNYWATSTYALYSRNGLEVMHANVSRGYGDYPLGVQLLEWWFMHVFSGGWHDRWLYIAYDLLLFSFVLPVFRHMKGKWYTIPVYILAALLLTSFSYNHYGLSPDAIMGVVYANCLLCAIRAWNGENRKHFQEISITAQLYMLTMTKSIGIFWAILAVIFYMLQMTRRAQCGINKICYRETIFQGMVMFLPALSSYAMWHYACSALDRTTYLTQNLRTIQLVWNTELVKLVRDYFYSLVNADSLFKKSLLIELLIFGIVYYFLCIIWKNKKKFVVSTAIFLFCTTWLYLLILLYSLPTMFWEKIILMSIFIT